MTVDARDAQMSATGVFHDPSVTEEYQGMVRAQVVVCAGMPSGSVVFLGDSRMRDLPVNEIVAAPAVNLSIGGDTTKGMLGRVIRYPRFDKASRVIVGTGINDLSHFADEEVIDYFKKLLSWLNSAGPRITVTAIFPLNEGKYQQSNATIVTGQKVTNDRIRTINERIQEVCLHLANVDYVNVNAELTGNDGNLRPEFSDDGLHLNAEGNKAWAAALRSRLLAY
jgi:lysophospholipase L1-like esterase